MQLQELHLEGFRNLEVSRWRPGAGFNLIAGANGAGKTSLVEAVHVLSHGRSFRASNPDALIQRGKDGFSVFASCVASPGQTFELGMARGDAGWTLRRNRLNVESLVEFVGSAAVVTVEPESHVLISGAAEHRRRYLDWLLFHVEPSFLPIWRRYSRSLRQRNAILRSGGAALAREIESWEAVLSESGEQIDAERKGLVSMLAAEVRAVVAELTPCLSVTGIRYRSGWASDASLAQSLAEGRPADIERGFTQRGPHRADWRLELAGEFSQGALSRGQNKLLALASLLAQARFHRTRTGAWPILVLDDLGAELDREHLSRVLAWLQRSGVQTFVTGTHFDEKWREWLTQDSQWFHVEQGRLTTLL